jgi:leader peptidase (prepilin peptidase)/N-methyltransferase
MNGDGQALLETASSIVEHVLADPVFWAERVLPGCFFLVLGGLLGSFLNVVAYRVPRGGSVCGRRSHCPACGAMIRGRDNVPVLGWLMLGGRCHACRGWISARYPIVEAIMAGGVMLLAVRELTTNGANLPGGSRGWADGPDLVLVHASWTVLALFAWHVLLLASLVVWSLFAVDGFQPSVRGMVAVLGVLGLGGVVLPGAAPLDLTGASGWAEGLPVMTAVAKAAMVAAVGMLLGTLAGAIPAFLLAPRDASWMWRTGCGMIGGVLGWQGAVAASAVGLGLAVAWSGLCLLAGGTPPGRTVRIRSASLALPIAAIIVVGWWRQLAWLTTSWFAHSILFASASRLQSGDIICGNLCS